MIATRWVVYRQHCFIWFETSTKGELIKILLTIAILVAVAKRVSDLSWLAMLLTMIGCLKVNWLVLLTRGRFKKISDGN